MSTQSLVTWSNRLRSKNRSAQSSPQYQPRQAELQFVIAAFSISEESVWSAASSQALECVKKSGVKSREWSGTMNETTSLSFSVNPVLPFRRLLRLLSRST
jgi:hypothetical protein